jgi:hypothetical protein
VIAETPRCRPLQQGGVLEYLQPSKGFMPSSDGYTVLRIVGAKFQIQRVDGIHQEKAFSPSRLLRKPRVAA